MTCKFAKKCPYILLVGVKYPLKQLFMCVLVSIHRGYSSLGTKPGSDDKCDDNPLCVRFRQQKGVAVYLVSPSGSSVRWGSEI